MSSKLSILDVLEDDLSKKDLADIAFESFIMLLKDSNNFFDTKTIQSLTRIMDKILFYLKTTKSDLCLTLINILYTYLDFVFRECLVLKKLHLF